MKKQKVFKRKVDKYHIVQDDKTISFDPKTKCLRFIASIHDPANSQTTHLGVFHIALDQKRIYLIKAMNQFLKLEVEFS